MMAMAQVVLTVKSKEIENIRGLTPFANDYCM